MAKTNKVDVYDLINQRIIDALETGTVPWRMPWKRNTEAPRNLISGKPYRSINHFLLRSMSYASPHWLTFKQARDLGGHVRKGEKACPVTFWKQWIPADQKELPKEAQTQRWLLRHYHVFNVLQCDGIDASKIPSAPRPSDDFKPLHECERILAGMPSPPRVTHQEDRAFYSPREDRVNMPPRERFQCPEAYYGVHFHEHIHSTMHPTRLDRKMGDGEELAAFGSKDYGREELVAELGAAYLSAEANIDAATIENSTAYIEGWLKRIREDKQALVKAASHAQRAADYILNRK